MRRHKILFSPGALMDIRDARSWYNLQQNGLGKRFIDDVRKTVASVKSNSYFASLKFKNIGTAACTTFPYAIHYEIDEVENLVRIVSIFHFSRRPYWL